MEAIINFIKEALAGKKMSAEWIVTLAVAIAGVIIGDLSMRYLIMKCGVYTPLLSASYY